MLNTIHKLREKYAYWILTCLVPLEVLPFLCEPDSRLGKILLLLKAATLGILYILYADKQKWYTHVVLMITCVSIGISTIQHGNAGTSILNMIMLSSLIVLPKIDICKKKLRWLYTLLAFGAIAIVTLCILSNYREGLPAFSWRGKYNTNTIGILLLAAYFYIESSLHVDKSIPKITFVDFALFVCASLMIYFSGCRSALLSLLTFILGYFIFRKTPFSRVFYWLCAAFGIVICLAMYLININAEQANQIRSVEILGKEVLSGREEIWSYVFAGFKESPLFGNSIECIKKPTGFESAHNVFMGILLSAGLLPSLAYTWFIFSLKHSDVSKNGMPIVPMQRICFTACLIVAAFECIFTDNRLNFLFLPLLLNGLNTYAACELNEHEETVQGNTKRHDPLKVIEVVILSLTLLIYISEPIALSIVRENLPKVVTQEYLESIGYDEKTHGNVLGNQQYSSELIKGVAWEWNGTSYDVIGQTNTTTSFVNFYMSFDQLPEWAKPGHNYHVVYESQTVRLRICCYDSMGREILTIETKNSLDFTIPIETVGIIVRITLEPNEPAYESVMPIIYPLDT